MEQSGSAGIAATGYEPGAQAATAAEPRRLAVNYLFLTGAEFTSKLLAFVTFSYLARMLGPLAYGSLEFTLAVMVFFVLPTDLGLGAYGAREIARNPDRSRTLLREITGLRAVCALGSILLLGVFVLVLPKSAAVKLLLLAYGLSLAGTPWLLIWFFQAHDQMRWVGAASVVRQAGFASLVFLFCRGPADLIRLGFIECGSVAITAAFCVYVTKSAMRFGWPRPYLHFRRFVHYARDASPIGLAELAWDFMWYFGTVVLGLLRSDSSVGWFGAAHRGLMALHTFVWLYFFNMLPSISRCADLPHSHLLRLMNGSLKVTAWSGVFGASLLTALSSSVMTLVYGRSFSGASTTFAILVWVLPVAMLSGHYRYALIGFNKQSHLLRCMILSAAAAVVLDLALIPVFGGPGAAVALLTANLINLGLVYYSVKRHVTEIRFVRQLAAPFAAAAFSALVFFVVPVSNVWLRVLIASAAYIAVAAVFVGGALLELVAAVVRPRRLGAKDAAL
jgi:O-antigen/teichoic acid export membrane protein